MKEEKQSRIPNVGATKILYKEVGQPGKMRKGKGTP